MNIRKIVLSEDGFKGAEIHYYNEKEKNGRQMLVLTKEYPKNPIHFGLEKMFKDLRLPLLEICGFVTDDMDKNVVAQMLMETKVFGLEIDSEYVILSGEKEVFDGKYVKLKTCKLQESDNYEGFDIVRELASSIQTETDEYLAGTKKVDDLEVAIRYLEAGKGKGVTLEDLNNMPPEQQKEWATKLLENNFGSVVMHSTEFNSVEETEIEQAEEIQAGDFSNLNVVAKEEIDVPVNEEEGEEF